MRLPLQISICLACVCAIADVRADFCNLPSLPPVERLRESAHAPLKLVEGGRCRFALVGRFKAEYAYRGPEGAGLLKFGRDSVNRAARALKTYFKETVGVEPLQLEENDPRAGDFPYVIALGPTRQAAALGMDGTKLPHEGFEVRTFAGGVAIVGMDGFAIPGAYDVFCWHSSRLTCNGTELGARDFAERALGVRTYSRLDDGLWTVRPTVRDLTLEPFAYRDRPRFRLRGNSAHNWRLRESTDIFCTEAPSPFAFANAHRDRLADLFYTDEDGVLQQSFDTYGKNYFDVTNPKLADQLIEDWKAYYAQNGTNTYWGTCWSPTSRCLFFGQVDAYRILGNERAKPYVDPADPKNMSDVYTAFHTYLANRVAEEFPGKRLVLMAYMNFLKPPKKFDRLPDNVEMLVCNGSPLFHGCPAYRKFFDENLARWTAMTKFKPAVYVYDAGFANDAVIVQTLRGYYEGAFLRDVMGRVDNEFIFPCFSPKSETYNWSYYPACLALWNPATDVEAVLEEYYRLMFGPKAGPLLLSFYRRLADRWSNHYLPLVKGGVDGSIPGPDYKLLYTKTFPEPVVRELMAALDEAERLLPSGTKERSRFEKFAGPYRRIFPDIIAYQNIRIPDIPVARRAGEIVLDGVPDEAAWSASTLPPFQRSFAGGAVRSPTPEAHILWDERGVYLGVRSPAPIRIDKDMWKGDSVEFIFTPAGASPHLYQFVCAANGEFMDIYRQWNPPRPIDVNWVAEGAKYVSKGTSGGWTAELFVPWTALRDKPPKAGDAWKMNLVSSRALPAWEDQSVSPTLQNNRRVDMFGKMIFR